jgi:predicted nucleotidyltransferase
VSGKVAPDLLQHWTTEIRKMMDDGNDQWKSLVPADLVPVYEKQLAHNA